jgi:hypothetical protein
LNVNALGHIEGNLRIFTGVLVWILSFCWYYGPARYVPIANQDVALFLTTPGYFMSYISHPGGILEYVGSFLSQLLRFRIPGALLLSGLVTLAFFLSTKLYRRISVGAEMLAVGVITAVLVAAMHNYYPHQVHHTLGLIMALLLVNHVPEEGWRGRIFILLALPLTYISCGGSAWIFMLMWLVRELSEKRKGAVELFLLGFIYPVAVFFLSAWLIFLQPLKDLAFSNLPFGSAYGPAIWPILFLAWILLILPLARVLSRLKPSRIRSTLAASIVSVAGAVLMLQFSYNRKNAEFFAIEQLAIEEEWHELLSYAGQHPSTNLFGTYYTNLALLHEGQLCSGLFNYPQPFGRKGLCFEWEAKGEVLRRGSDFFWAIGFANEAHHWAFESMIVDGVTRRNLKMLIKTELVRGNFRVAEKYIGLMDRTLFDRSLAAHYRTFLNNPDAILRDPELGPGKRIHVDKDFFADGLDMEKNLRFMLSNDPANRPAYDYLMAIFLLERRVDDIVALLPDYLNRSGEPLPALLDETLLVYKITHREDNLTNLGVSVPTIRKFDEYTRILRQYRDEKEAARMLYPGFRNTFWFYLNFSSPVNS